jgi:DNA-binding response OmpR family regulator
MTGESKSEKVIAAKKAGVNSYIVKPFNVQTLKAKIEVAFATRTGPLPERHDAVAVAEASVATPTSAAARKKFGGIFTGSL